MREIRYLIFVRRVAGNISSTYHKIRVNRWLGDASVLDLDKSTWLDEMMLKTVTVFDALDRFGLSLARLMHYHK